MKEKFFMLLPVLLLGASLGGWAFMISAATADPSFAVEPSYYRKASLFDEELARRAASRKLGWRVDVVAFERPSGGPMRLRVALSDREGMPVAGAVLAVEAVPNLRASEVRTGAPVTTDQAGHAEWTFAAGPSGLWELRLQATRREDVFSQVVRQDVAKSGGST